MSAIEDAKKLFFDGVNLLDGREFEQAELKFRDALKLAPENTSILINLCVALFEQDKPSESRAFAEKAIAITRDSVDAHFLAAECFAKEKKHAEAARAFARLLEISPGASFVKGYMLRQKMLCGDWSGFSQDVESIDKDTCDGKKSAEPFGYQAVAKSPQDLKACAQSFTAENFPGREATPWTGGPFATDRIHIGYLSGEFRNQATAILTAGLFELHDKGRFKLFAFDNGWDDGSELRTRMNKAFDAVIDIARLSDPQAAEIIRRNQIAILVNLNGYFGRARMGVFSRKPAPVQVNYLGFPGTLGADYIDYIIADARVIPPEDRPCYVEKVVYLPDTYQVNDSKRPIAAQAPTRAEAGLPPTGFVFCCFNSTYKIVPDVFDVWMRLLDRIDGSVMWLFETNAQAAQNLRLEAARRGIAPERLVFAPLIALPDHLARHRLADLFLDTLPYNAHTTASDALWAGLPVLTCVGSTFPGRVAGSLLDAIGMPELVTRSLEEYEAMALKLAGDPDFLASLKAKLARNRNSCLLFDTARFARHIEAAYTAMWDRYRRGERPESFSVEPIA
jgi:predicted O-linked N-acetylglucosamine transferase (SPINDLY family)